MYIVFRKCDNYTNFSFMWGSLRLTPIKQDVRISQLGEGTQQLLKIYGRLYISMEWGCVPLVSSPMYVCMYVIEEVSVYT